MAITLNIPNEYPNIIIADRLWRKNALFKKIECKGCNSKRMRKMNTSAGFSKYFLTFEPLKLQYYSDYEN